MGAGDRLRSLFGWADEVEVIEVPVDGVAGVVPPVPAASGAVSPGEPVREALGDTAQSLIDEDRGWRSLISGGMRELTWAQIIENLNDAVLAYRSNPLAYRLVELTTDHVLGDGMALRSEDPAIQRELDLWWHHPLNNLGTRQFEMCTSLSLDGEVYVSVHQNPFDATSYVRLIPAALIDRIETNPDDLEDELRFHQTAQPMTPDTLMRMPSAIQAEGRWWDRGDMYHFAVNRPPGVVRGQSDLAPILPWLRRYRDWLLDRVRVNKFKSAFLWHVTLTGADARAVNQRRGELAQPPLPGSVIVSNEKEVWAAVKPEIAAQDVYRDGMALRLMIAAGAGVPLFYLAEAEGTARATAAEMNLPTLRHYRRRQLYFGFLMRQLAVDALHRRGLVEATVADVVAEFQELVPQDSLAMAQAAQAVTSALTAAAGAGWVDAGSAARLFAKFVGEPVDLAPLVEEVGASPRGSGLPGGARPRLRVADPRAAEPLPPPFGGGGLVAPEPIVNI